MDHTEAKFKGHGDTELYYQCWHPANGVTARAALAVVHGFGEHSGRYGNVVDWFVPRGYVLYAFDQRGHGHSTGKRGHIDSYDCVHGDVASFLDLVHRQEPDLPLYLLGHSQGGTIALNYALREPAGLAGVIASAPMLSDPNISPLLLQLSKLLSKMWPGLQMEVGLDTASLSREQAVVDAYVNDPLVHGKATPRFGTEFQRAIDWNHAHAADMAIPCLIVNGSDDRLIPPEGSHTFFENVSFADKEHIEYEGHYHEVFNDVGKEIVLADVEAWLNQHLEQK